VCRGEALQKSHHHHHHKKHTHTHYRNIMDLQRHTMFSLGGYDLGNQATVVRVAVEGCSGFRVQGSFGVQIWGGAMWLVRVMLLVLLQC